MLNTEQKKELFKKKLRLTKNLIEEIYLHFEDKVFLAFSGSKNSIVLLDLFKKTYPNIRVVYNDIHIDYPEIREFVKKIRNSEIIYPNTDYFNIITKYGYQVLNQETSLRVERAIKNPNTIHKLTSFTKNGKKTFSEDRTFLLNADFKITSQCCKLLRFQSIKEYAKNNALIPIYGKICKGFYNIINLDMYIGKQLKLKRNTNLYPIYHWNAWDVNYYINKNKLKYPKHLDVPEFQKNCTLCLCNIAKEHRATKFKKIKEHYPDKYAEAMNLYNYQKVLKFLNIDY